MKFDYSTVGLSNAAIDFRMSLHDFLFLRPFMAFDFVKKCTKEVNEIVDILSQKKIKVKMVEIKHYSYHTNRLDFDKMYDWHKKTFHHAFLFECVDPSQGRFAIEYINSYDGPNGFAIYKHDKKYNSYFRIDFIKTFGNKNRIENLSESIDDFLKHGSNNLVI